MSSHIFIATTQGLVAIQNITSIDDPDISSVVSINGTSTTANISSSYHNFVKKGVGIIQQMFGACSYRVDISARIDQGNSWQLAMYLGHLAQSKGILGNGEVKPGDNVICATGEVNTSNQQILAVTNIPRKLSLANSQLKTWGALGADITFVIPKANQGDIKAAPFIKFAPTLEHAANLLPEVKTNNKSINQTNTGDKTEKTTLKEKINVNASFKYIALVTAGLLIITAGWQFFDVNSENTHSSQSSYFSLNTQLLSDLKKGNTCAQIDSQITPASKFIFAEHRLKQLCSLSLQTDKNISQVLLVANDAYTVFPLVNNSNNWAIPLPKNQSADRSYYLVVLQQALSEETIEKLRLYREAMPKPEMLTESELNKWLRKEQAEFVIYQHKLRS